MKTHTVIYKHVGETPLQALEGFRKTRPEFRDAPLTYSGRLDPMAEGKLLILAGEECKNRAEYDGLDKEYEFEILFGFKSDTGDVLGLVDSCDGAKEFFTNNVGEAAKSFLGTHSFPYPAFSSKTVHGRPLFHHAIQNNLESIEIPEVSVRIHKIRFCSIESVSRGELIENILKKIDLLKIDTVDSRTGSGFRKDEILKRWGTFRVGELNRHIIAKFQATVSSGTYIRVLASRIAEKLGTCGLAYSIRRTKIGCYVPVTKNFGFWRKMF